MNKTSPFIKEYSDLKSSAIDKVVIDKRKKLFSVKYVKRSRGFYEFICPYPKDVIKFLNLIIKEKYSLGAAVNYLIVNQIIINKNSI